MNVFITLTLHERHGVSEQWQFDYLFLDRCYNYRFAKNIDRHLGSTAAEVPVKFQSNWKSPNMNPVTSRLHKIMRQDVLPPSELMPWVDSLASGST